jgi:hypothetical protein
MMAGSVFPAVEFTSERSQTQYSALTATHGMLCAVVQASVKEDKAHQKT